ncbi:hypothetical protein FQ707_13865 [Bacteroidaceae bacterium HV4-6-C5C]|nr:hypothetical protein FQ707_13865 [Bacteroidaceae bacterium HV4-6-C5C]
MRRFLLTYIILSILGVLSIYAQQTLNRNNRDQFGNQVDPSTRPANLNNDSTEIQSLPPKLYMWRLSETLGNRIIIPVDTVYHHFQNTNLVEGITGHYNYIGNLGSPRLSRSFFERSNYDYLSIFMEPYSSFFQNPDQINFTNSNVPYTNLTYYKAGDKVNGEERFKSYFSVNVNKRAAFGFNIDYLYGRGLYSNQSTAHFNGRLFGSYIGDRYQIQGVFNTYNLKMNENGGIQNDQYITRPENMAEGKKEYESTTIPVNFDQPATNRNNDYYLYLTHRYRLGFKRNTTKIDEQKKDTVDLEQFVPVTSFIHTFKLEGAKHSYGAKTEAEKLYANSYFSKKLASKDSTEAFSIKNVFGVALLEGFNKYAKAGLTAYISHKYSRYDLMDTLQVRTDLDSVKTTRYTEQEVYIGGELAKKQGRFLHYNINGEIGLLDKALGQFRVNGNMDMNFSFGKDTVNLIGRAFITNTLPSFYMRHYHSNHFFWDNDNMDKEFRSHIEGELNFERWGSNLRIGVENIKNYTYFNQNALPEQYSQNIQIVSATFKQNFRLGIFHLDNEVTWQKSSQKDIIPLPDLSFYHNFYLQAKVAKKVLSIQLGADVSYFSKYHAPAYMPAIQQYHVQSATDQVEIGGYPIVNVYANLHLKRTRFFVMMYHVNQGMGNRNSFLVPHYPINPRLLKLGLSWNMFD